MGIFNKSKTNSFYFKESRYDIKLKYDIDISKILLEISVPSTNFTEDFDLALPGISWNYSDVSGSAIIESRSRNHLMHFLAHAKIVLEDDRRKIIFYDENGENLSNLIFRCCYPSNAITYIYASFKLEASTFESSISHQSSNNAINFLKDNRLSSVKNVTPYDYDNSRSTDSSLIFGDDSKQYSAKNNLELKSSSTSLKTKLISKRSLSNNEGDLPITTEESLNVKKSPKYVDEWRNNVIYPLKISLFRDNVFNYIHKKGSKSIYGNRRKVEIRSGYLEIDIPLPEVFVLKFDCSYISGKGDLLNLGKDILYIKDDWIYRRSPSSIFDEPLYDLKSGYNLFILEIGESSTFQMNNEKSYPISWDPSKITKIKLGSGKIHLDLKQIDIFSP